MVLKSIKIPENLRGAVGRAVDAVLPPRCVMSGDVVEAQGALSPQSWKSLHFIADPICGCCGVPFEYGFEGDTLCMACLDDPPIFETCRSSIVYNEESRSLILGFKHGDKTHAVKTFTPWLRRAGAQMIAQADFIIPVPLHPLRLLGRRYNQSGVMAWDLARETGVVCRVDLLRRVRFTVSQGHMNAAGRSANVRGAFAVRKGEMLRGKTVILVDDVFTSGATASECARVLKESGVAAVHILTLARVVRKQT